MKYKLGIFLFFIFIYLFIFNTKSRRYRNVMGIEWLLITSIIIIIIVIIPLYSIVAKSKG